MKTTFPYTMVYDTEYSVKERIYFPALFPYREQFFSV